MFVLVMFLILTLINVVASISMGPLFFVSFAVLFVITLVLCLPFYYIWEFFYFRGKEFREIKKCIQKYIDECNELNSHIEELKSSYVDVNYTDYGIATYVDNSRYNFKRKGWKTYQKDKNIYDCSASVCRNAQQQPFKYICKYFNIQPNEETLSRFEKVLNDFSAAEQGRKLLMEQKQEIVASISKLIPFFIRHFRKNKLVKKLGFDDIDLSNVHYPVFCFRYISAGGNSSMKCEVVFDLENLERFIQFLSEKVKFRKSIAGQRALMTARLREYIKKRDNYACRCCGISTREEPHLLLEIDHIIPLSKNGITSEENLQTLCWKCNRSKGSKMPE